MGSSRKSIFQPPPPPNPNAGGAQASKSTYNVPTVGGYDSNNYQPFFTQQAMTSEAGMPQSFFNRYGSAGSDPALIPYNATGSGISNNVYRFAQSAPLTGLGLGGL
jgi:hypothetical protein